MKPRDTRGTADQHDRNHRKTVAAGEMPFHPQRPDNNQ
jgi:hypothetical protein